MKADHDQTGCYARRAAVGCYWGKRLFVGGLGEHRGAKHSVFFCPYTIETIRTMPMVGVERGLLPIYFRLHVRALGVDPCPYHDHNPAILYGRSESQANQTINMPQSATC
jgi:hypothetical protein